MYKPTLIAVEALLNIEHDRLPRVPGTESAFFQLDADVVAGLEDIGAVRRVGTVEASSQVVNQVLATSSQAFEGSSAVTFADVADASSQAGATLLVDPGKPLFDAEATLATLADAQAALQAQNLELVTARNLAEDAIAGARNLQNALTESDAALADARAQIEALSKPADTGSAQLDQAEADASSSTTGTGAADTSGDAAKATKPAAKTTTKAKAGSK